MSDHIIRALGYTLMHSLWQGILLALITGSIVVFTKKSKPAFRYNLLIGALTLFAVGVTATFIGQLQKPAAGSAPIQTIAAHAISAAPVPAKTTGPIARPTGTGTITQTVISYFNTHYNTIVLIWFLIICARSIQMAVGLHSISHLKRTSISSVSEDWERRLLQLAKQLHIEQTIQLMESGLAKVPMVVGHLKPVILIPIGLINSLTANEVEAILLHELAHIRRRDYLVNLMQSFMEIVFFFNPAVLWISQLIKTERENCCDDLTIAQSRNKESYIRALVSCEEYKATGTPYAMAFPGTGANNTLLCRVTRIVRNRNYSLSLFEKTILAVCLVVTGLGISAFTAREHLKKAPQPVRAQQIEKVKATKNDTTVKKQPAPFHKPLSLRAKPDTIKQTFDTTHAIARELYRENLLTDTDHVTISLDERELIVNGVRMPEQVHQVIYRQFGPSGNFGASNTQPYGIIYSGSYDNNLQGLSKEIGDEIARDNLVSDKNHFSYKFSRDELTIDGVRQSDQLRRRFVDKYFKPDDQFNLSYNFRDPGWYAYETKKNYSSDSNGYRNSDAYYQSLAEEQKRAEDKIDKKLVADLLQDGLITDPKNVSFTLNDKSMIVNGQKQSDEMYKKYKEKYRPRDTGSGWSWNYTNHE